MTSWVVADSGIYLAHLVDSDPTRQKAVALSKYWQANGIQVAAPSLFRYEVISVIRRNVHRGLLTLQEGEAACDALLAQAVQLFIDTELTKRAYELATQFNRPTAYDSQYLAVAERLNCEFWTADERLFNAVSQELPWVKWLHHFTE